MEIAFRTDASLQIGSGHVMRCLTLAEALRDRGATCRFICREHPGNLLAQIRTRGFVALALPVLMTDDDQRPQPCEPVHRNWLGSSWQADAEQTLDLLQGVRPDWLIVDHYALDRRWEDAVRPASGALMAIDDLADRLHACDLLLDQNLGRTPQDYVDLVPAPCQILAGPRYALLRPQFAQLRGYSLARRTANAPLTNILIAMGGVDQANATTSVLQTLRDGVLLPGNCGITIIMGAQAPWLRDVVDFAARLPWHAEIAIGVDDMARRMAESDLAIGAAGGTAWERCCLGLPALLAVLAQNQWPGARALQASGASRLLGEVADIPQRLGPELALLMQEGALQRMSRLASAITDGLGVARVSEILEGHARH